MKKLFILIVAMPFVVDAQENRKSESGKKISVGFSFSPNYASRSLINNDGSSSGDMVIDVRDKIEKGKFGYTMGLNLNIPLSGKLGFQTGLLYSNQGYKTPRREVFYPSGTPRPSEPTHVKSVLTINYLDVPMKINYVSTNGKIRFIAGGGIAASFLLKESDVYTFYYVNGSKNEVNNYSTYDHKNFNLFALISAGMEFKLKGNLSFRTEPSFRYGLLKTIDDVPVSERLWNIGLNTGLYCKLE